MFGRKDKKGDRKRGREREVKREGGAGGGVGGLGAMFGLDMGSIPDDADLEAELLALEGKAPKKGGKSSNKNAMSIGQLDEMVAGIQNIGEEDEEDEDMSDADESELLGELEELERDETTPEPEPETKPAPSPRRPLRANAPPKPVSVSQSQPQQVAEGRESVKMVSQRLDMYKQAITEAESSGEGGKIKRYKRGLGTLEQMLKSARAGKQFNEDDLPAAVFVKQGTASLNPSPRVAEQVAPPAVQKPIPQTKSLPSSNLIDLDDPEFDEFNISEEDLAAMTATFMDDRKPAQSEQVSVTMTSTTQPKPQSRPAAQPKPQPRPAAQPSPTPAPRPKPTPSSRTHHKPAPPPPKPAPKRPEGLLDLDDPEFDEFTLTEDDLTAMTLSFSDDRKKPKLDEQPMQAEPPSYSSLPKSAQRNSTTTTVQPVPYHSAAQSAAQSAAHQTPISSAKPTQSLPSHVSEPPSRNEVDEKEVIQKLLVERKEQYQLAAKAQKTEGKCKEFRLVAVQFARVSKAFEQGQEIDLSLMPGPPPGYQSSYNIDISKHTPKPQPSNKDAQVQSPNSSLTSNPEKEEEEVNPDIPIPKTTLEALTQRIAKYKDGIKFAEQNGESSRVRRLGRIVKSYEEAVRATKAGKPYDYDELPAPPGYPPIPGPKTMSRPGVVSAIPLTQSLPVKPIAAMSAPRRLTPSINDEQLAFIEQRRSELHMAARQEQTKGNKEGALHFLKLRKGLDTMLEAAKCGMPINMQEVPPSPFGDVAQTKPSSAVLAHLKPATESDEPTFDLIEKQLQKQIEICDSNAENYEKMGSTAASLQYQNMSQNCQRELLALKGIRSQRLAPPNFTLETRTFAVVNTNTELSSGVCEIAVVRGLNIPKPSGHEEKDMNVYVEIEFPWPPENLQKQSTDNVKQTCNPEFEGQKFQFDIDRKKIKTMTRTFKRTPVKYGVWQKRTLRKDVFIGQGLMNLESLETKTETQQVVDLLDEKGRKQIGGKLEVAARLREPLTGTSKEEREEQWLVFQEAIAAKSSVKMPTPSVAKPAKSPGGGGAKGGAGINYALLSPIKVESMISMEAIKLELSLVQSALKAGHRDKSTALRGKMIQERMQTIKQRLQSDASFRQGYSKTVTKEMQGEQRLETQLAQLGKAKQTEVVILQKRRAAMEKELKALHERKM